MSFLKALPRKALPLTRSRVFSTSPFVSRSVVEGTQDALKAADRKLSKAAVKAIETGGESLEFPDMGLPTLDVVFFWRQPERRCPGNDGADPCFSESATEAVKSTLGSTAAKTEESASEVASQAKEKAYEMKNKTHEVAGEAKGRANELTGEAMGKAHAFTGEAKGKAHEFTGEAKGKASEVKGQAKGTVEEVTRRM